MRVDFFLVAENQPDVFGRLYSFLVVHVVMI